MTKRTLDAFTNASTGLFADNATGDISEGDLRDFTETSFAGLYSGAAVTTDGDITGTVGSMTVWDISGLTADADFILPATCAVGDRVGLMISTGDDAYEIDLHTPSASTDTINGVDSSVGTASWSRVFITGETIIFRCVVANSAWIVEYDGRIPCHAVLRKTNAQTVADNTVDPVEHNQEETDIGDIAAVSTGAGDSGTITLRRDGCGIVMHYAITGGDTTNFTDGETISTRLNLNGTIMNNASNRFGGTLQGGGEQMRTGSVSRSFSDGDYFDQDLFQNAGGTNPLEYASDYQEAFLSFIEIF